MRPDLTKILAGCVEANRKTRGKLYYPGCFAIENKLRKWLEAKVDIKVIRNPSFLSCFKLKCDLWRTYTS